MAKRKKSDESPLGDLILDILSRAGPDGLTEEQVQVEIFERRSELPKEARKRIETDWVAATKRIMSRKRQSGADWWT